VATASAAPASNQELLGVTSREVAHHCSEMVHLWYKQSILCKGACGALAALVNRREGAPVGASGVGGSADNLLKVPEHIASDFAYIREWRLPARKVCNPSQQTG
jgi:hypothetical protein